MRIPYGIYAEAEEISEGSFGGTLKTIFEGIFEKILGAIPYETFSNAWMNFL